MEIFFLDSCALSRGPPREIGALLVCCERSVGWEGGGLQAGVAGEGFVVKTSKGRGVGGMGREDEDRWTSIGSG
jgi:hypothetical protein